MTKIYSVKDIDMGIAPDAYLDNIICGNSIDALRLFPSE